MNAVWELFVVLQIFPFLLVPFFAAFLAIKLYGVVWFNISDSHTQ